MTSFMAPGIWGTGRSGGAGRLAAEIALVSAGILILIKVWRRGVGARRGRPPQSCNPGTGNDLAGRALLHSRGCPSPRHIPQGTSSRD